LVFFGFGCYHTARSIWSIIHIRVSRKILCTIHAVQGLQGTLGYSGMTTAWDVCKVDKVFVLPYASMQLVFDGVLSIHSTVLCIEGMRRGGGQACQVRKSKHKPRRGGYFPCIESLSREVITGLCV
jgi:hypothetical protein